MFHNVLMTTLTPIRDTKEIQCWDNRPLATIWPEIKQEKVKDTNIKKTIQKKKRNRTMFTTEQVKVLEKVFARSKYIDVERRREISECLKIEQKCIKIWFQNRRMKEKKELSESCDSTSESQVSSLVSMSPPLEPTQHSNNESDNGSTPPDANINVRNSQYYPNTPNHFVKTQIHQDMHSYEASNNPIIPEYLNYYNNNFNSNVLRNNTDYTTQYYPPQTEFQYYHNTGEISNQYTAAYWPTNMYDTSYF